MLHEMNGSDYLDFATSYICLIHHPTNATKVVGVRVRVDNRNHRPFANLFVDEIQSRLGGLLGGKRIEDDPVFLRSQGLFDLLPYSKQPNKEAVFLGNANPTRSVKS
jgi:hypothetical protein